MFFSDAIDWHKELRGRHLGIHNFSLGTLEAYFGLQTGISNLEDNIVSITNFNRTKTWIFRSNDYNFVRFRELQRLGPIYSQEALPLEKRAVFHELAYDLKKVFDPGSYSNSKKRNQRIKYPIKWIISNKYYFLQHITDILKFEQLHTEWVQHKLTDPSTYQIMFPKKRYFNCVVQAKKNPDSYLCFSLWKEFQLMGVRVLYIEDDIAFDLANFTRFWDLPSNFSEYFATYTMSILYDIHKIRTLNCGASLNKKLSIFKQHWPHYEVMSYMYSQLKL